ncbi:hypothetical protein CR513_17878, partial [Mucuna pruriens]
MYETPSLSHFYRSYTSQLFSLKKCVENTKQTEGPIELYYNTLQGLWREIDFRRPNPMKCAGDIENKIPFCRKIMSSPFWMASMTDSTKFVVMCCKPSCFQLLSMPTHIKTSAVMATKGTGSLQPSRTLQLSKDTSMNLFGGKSNPINK